MPALQAPVLGNSGRAIVSAELLADIGAQSGDAVAAYRGDGSPCSVCVAHVGREDDPCCFDDSIILPGWSCGDRDRLARLGPVQAAERVVVVADASDAEQNSIATALRQRVVCAGVRLRAPRGLFARVAGTVPEGPVRVLRNTAVSFEVGGTSEENASLPESTLQMLRSSFHQVGSMASAPPTPAPGGGAEAEVAGMEEAMALLRRMVAMVTPSRRRSVRQLGLRVPKGVLLLGPPGVGKTSIVRAVTREAGVPVISASASDVTGNQFGDSEARLRELFAEAEQAAAAKGCCVLFIDEIDALCPKRDGASKRTARLVAQLLTLLDGAGETGGGIMLLAATNRPNAIDAALRRPGRLDREVAIPPPNEAAREAILRLHMKRVPLDAGVSVAELARHCVGYVGADLAALVREAALSALQRHRKQLEAGEVSEEGSVDGVCMSDFEAAMRQVGGSATRGAVVQVAQTRWEDIGGLGDVKLKLQQAVEWPLQHAAAFRRLGIRAARGILLYGPPGCSKTSLVKAVATTANATFLSTNCASLFSSFLGEAERTVRELFARARAGVPSVIFLDEIDALVGSRGTASGSRDATGVQERVLATLLNELDGIEGAEGVLLVAATNRPDRVDSALLRPGRLDQIVYVPPPADTAARLEILELFTKRMPLGADVDLRAVASTAQDFTGAELESLCREAAYAALREDISSPLVQQRHMLAACEGITPALRGVDCSTYEDLHPSRRVVRALASVDAVGDTTEGGDDAVDALGVDMGGVVIGDGLEGEESSDGEWC